MKGYRASVTQVIRTHSSALDQRGQVHHLEFALFVFYALIGVKYPQILAKCDPESTSPAATVRRGYAAKHCPSPRRVRSVHKSHSLRLHTSWIAIHCRFVLQ